MTGTDAVTVGCGALLLGVGTVVAGGVACGLSVAETLASGLLVTQALASGLLVAETASVGRTAVGVVNPVDALGRGAWVALGRTVAVGEGDVEATGRADDVTLGVGIVVADTEDVLVGRREPSPSKAQADTAATLSTLTAAPIPIIRIPILGRPFSACNTRMFRHSARRIAPHRLREGIEPAAHLRRFHAIGALGGCTSARIFRKTGSIRHLHRPGDPAPPGSTPVRSRRGYSPITERPAQWPW